MISITFFGAAEASSDIATHISLQTHQRLAVSAVSSGSVLQENASTQKVSILQQVALDM